MNKTKKILIVEDEEPVRKAIVDSVKNMDFKILEAKNGEEGLDMALSEHPNLILLDLLMPKISGQQLCERLRADDWGKDAHIIVLTNLDSKTEKEGLRSLNVEDYIVKSNIKLEELVDTIKEKIGD